MTIERNSTVRLIAALVACTFAAHLSAGAASAPAAGEAAALKVTVKYTGKGDVDKAHRIWIWAFDTPDIGPAALPIGESSIDVNGGEATFNDLGLEKVYLAVAYDIAGGFMGSAPPPSGSPVVIHSDKPGVPAATAVATGDKARVTITFDDTQKMP